MRREDGISWQVCVAAAVCTALGGNLLVNAIPWPEFMVRGFLAEAETARQMGGEFLVMTLVIAPLAEEAVFRAGLYRFLRRFFCFAPAALLSAAAFGLYHGNWIQGLYGFLNGLVLAWGYEKGRPGGFPLAALMHGAANLAVLAVF